MTITYIKKDITKVTEGIIAQGVNCQTKMGSGVAKALYTQWPLVRKQYIEKNYFGPNCLGKVDFVELGDVTVANCYTQEFYGREKIRYASIEAVTECLFKVIRNAYTYCVPLYLPRIGCGLGGLNWDTEVGPILETLDNQFNSEVAITVCDLL